MNCFDCEFDKGYDSIVRMTEHIQNLMNDEKTEEIMNVFKDKDTPMYKLAGSIMLKMGPYLKEHKPDVVGLISCFFVRSDEETGKQSFITIVKEFKEVMSNDQVKELFSFAQNQMPTRSGSVQENITDEVN